MSGTREHAKSLSLGDFSGAAAFTVGVISAWLYAAGWTYSYHYFDRFGIPLMMVDIPKENYFVYGGVVMRQFPVWGLGTGIAVLVLVGLWRWIGGMLGCLALPLCVLAVLLLFWLGHAAALTAAHDEYVRQRESDYGSYPRVQVWPSGDAKQPAGSPFASDDLTQGCYRLLLHNKDRLFLMRSFKGAPAAGANPAWASNRDNPGVTGLYQLQMIETVASRLATTPRPSK